MHLLTALNLSVSLLATLVATAKGYYKVTKETSTVTLPSGEQCYFVITKCSHPKSFECSWTSRPNHDVFGQGIHHLPFYMYPPINHEPRNYMARLLCRISRDKKDDRSSNELVKHQTLKPKVQEIIQPLTATKEMLSNVSIPQLNKEPLRFFNKSTIKRFFHDIVNHDDFETAVGLMKLACFPLTFSLSEDSLLDQIVALLK